MSNNAKNINDCVISFLGLMFLIFSTLKLCGIITWSWWVVTMPLWGGLAILVAMFVIFVTMGFIALVLIILKSIFKG